MAVVVDNYTELDPTYEEPCMTCFRQIRYHKSEAIIDRRYTALGYCITCPNCNNPMRVSFTNAKLC